MLFIAPLLILTLIGCSTAHHTNDKLPEKAAASTENVYINWENLLSGAQYNPLIALEFYDSASYWGRPMIGYSVNIPKELIGAFNLKPEEDVSYIQFWWELRLYDQNGNLMQNVSYGSLLNDGEEINYSDTKFLYYIHDLTESGIYALAVYIEYFDKELEKDVYLRSAPLFIDLMIETDESVVEIAAEASISTLTYVLKGEFYLDSVYGFSNYSNDTTDKPVHFGFPDAQGGLIHSGRPSEFNDYYSDIQRFYDFTSDGDTARLKMTLPKTLPVKFIENFDDFYEGDAKKAPAEYAYMEVFKRFYPYEWLSKRTEEGVYHVSVNLDGVLHEQPGLIKAQIEEYLKNTEVILLWENMDSLIEQGYISTDENGRAEGFMNGSLFNFTDQILTDIIYETDAYRWYGNLGADGATYTVRMNSSGNWEVTSITNGWIS